MNNTLTRTLNTHYRKPKKCVVHTTQADDKQRKNHKNHNTPQKTKKMKDTDSTNKHGGETMCSRRVCNVCLLLDTRCAARIVKYSKNHVGDKFYIKKTEDSSRFINGYFQAFIKFVRAMHEQHVPY